jgi:hypothetical protein
MEFFLCFLRLSDPFISGDADLDRESLVFFFLNTNLSQSSDQLMEQVINQSLAQSINQSIKQSINQPINRSFEAS